MKGRERHNYFTKRVKYLWHIWIHPKRTWTSRLCTHVNADMMRLYDILRISYFTDSGISEKSGRGVPKIVEVYGRNAFTFEENDIVVTIPFNKVNQVGNKVGDKIGNIQSALNQTRQTILSEMRNNPNITKAELSRILGISTTAIDNNISFLKNEYIERKGSNKTGYWIVNEKKI